jgi:spore coat polysaccharide biosynthesis predicted glycosyltransferase SpsG
MQNAIAFHGGNEVSRFHLTIDLSAMSVCVRADGGGGTGLGHLVRCFALTEAIRATAGDFSSEEGDDNDNGDWGARSVRVVWAVRAVSAGGEKEGQEGLDPRVSGTVGRALAGASGDLILPPSIGDDKPPLLDEDAVDGMSDDEVERRHEIPEISAWVVRSAARFLIIDNYPFPSRGISLLRARIHREWPLAHADAAVPFIVVADDTQARSGCDLRIGPWAVHQGDAEPAVRTLRGPQFHLIRPEFSRQVPLAPRDESRRGWVVCFGGTDFKNMSRKLLEALLASPTLKDVAEELVFVSSDQQAQEQGLDELIARWPRKAERRPWVDAAGMAVLFAESKAAITSCSGVGVEAMAMQSPGILVNWVENQGTIATTLAGMGVQVVSNAEDAAAKLLSSSATPVNEGTLDVFGALRVAGELWEKSLVIGSSANLTARRATLQDSPLFRGLAQKFGSSGSSVRWTAERILSSTSHVLVLERGGVPVACGVRSQDKETISSLGGPLDSAATEFLRKILPEATIDNPEATMDTP